MCLEVSIPLFIRTSLAYRKLIFKGCSANTKTYSLAIHSLLSIVAWTPLRATYTFSTVMLTSMRLVMLRSKGKFQASYSLMVRSSVLVAIVTAAATVPNWI
ncbi:hypothetical protein PMAYCL1PPCAC_16203, partial [Pristionchus mayeri]